MDKNEQLVDAVLKTAKSGRGPGGLKQLRCSEAFELAGKHEVKISEIGKICNRNNIKIRKCQLGCFA